MAPRTYLRPDVEGGDAQIPPLAPPAPAPGEFHQLPVGRQEEGTLYRGIRGVSPDARGATVP